MIEALRGEPFDTLDVSPEERERRKQHFKQHSRREMEALRVRTGCIDVKSPLACFLYLLVRNEVPMGVVEELVHEATCVPMDGDATEQYCNGFLAQWAVDVASRLEGEHG